MKALTKDDLASAEFNALACRSKAHRAAYKMGFLAFISGYRWFANPYRNNGFRSAWIDGWEKSKFLAGLAGESQQGERT